MNPLGKFLITFVLFLLFLPLYYELFTTVITVETPTNPVDVLLLPLGVAVVGILFVVLIKLWGAYILRVVEMLVLLYFLPLFFYPLTAILNLEGFEWGLALLFIIFSHLSPRMKTVVALAVAVVASSLLAHLTPYPYILLLSIMLSIYDYLAVHKTTIMKTLADAATKMGTVLTVGVGKKPKMAVGEGRGSYIEMGLGDFFVAGSLLLGAYDISPLFAFLTFIGIVLGLLLLFKDLVEKKFLPALPYIVGGAGLAFLIYALIPSGGL